ncbi:hypothetical protein NL532_24210 [Mesorhizobium sp. C120A]|uniref:hypothetical protein n=1 Tax=unclassified Mesorhizobium TaxID=325217 RepID=UPI0012DFA4F6|nr:MULTISPECIES: hypothetical protein [unclassified Mesorhizobium]WJI43714.1 hypothetical protein NL532_24210 [Mesorhizobium sp. C120A]
MNQWHLSWKTPIENAADKLDHGTIARGEQHGNAKLTEADVRSIRSLGGGLLHREIGDLFGVTSSTISVIRSRKSWGWFK